ncbi:HNH endonuclease [Halovulum sp. GXIMD14794]
MAEPDYTRLPPRTCLLEPIPEIFVAQDFLIEAGRQHVSGDLAAAQDALRMADIPIIAEWTEALWGKTSASIHRYRKIEDVSPILAKEQRVETRMPSVAIKRALIERDGHHCRFCGIPVIRSEVRTLLRKAYPDALRWGSTNSSQHTAFQAMWLQYDHLVSHSRGGDNGMDNMAITCAPCNFGRNDFLLEEVALLNPLYREPVKNDWDGLEHVLRS